MGNEFKTSVYLFMSKLLRDSNFLFQILPTYVDFQSAEEVAKISPWFKDVSCKSGKDGTKLTMKIIKESKKFLSNHFF